MRLNLSRLSPFRLPASAFPRAGEGAVYGSTALGCAAVRSPPRSAGHAAAVLASGGSKVAPQHVASPYVHRALPVQLAGCGMPVFLVHHSLAKPPFPNLCIPEGHCCPSCCPTHGCLYPATVWLRAAGEFEKRQAAAILVERVARGFVGTRRVARVRLARGCQWLYVALCMGMVPRPLCEL
jgi:hypothetical protein